MKSVILFLLIIFMSSMRSSDRICIKGEIEYSIADYKSEFKPHYAHLFHSWFAKPLLQLVCHQEIKNLPVTNKNKRSTVSPSQHHVIEPLFVDLSTFNGIYAKRIYSLEPQARSVRFTCGYFHYLFILADNEYIELTKDTLANQDLIQTKLNKSFNAEELQQMKAHYKYEMFCDHLTFLPPDYVKKADSVLYDDIKE